jgi:hypothetical protein
MLTFFHLFQRLNYITTLYNFKGRFDRLNSRSFFNKGLKINTFSSVECKTFSDVEAFEPI